LAVDKLAQLRLIYILTWILQNAEASSMEPFTAMSSTKRSPTPLVEPLPSATDRWFIRREATLIEAVRGGAISFDEACRRYQLSTEEVTGWLAAFEKHGVPGLRATRFQIYRDSPRQPADLSRGRRAPEAFTSRRTGDAQIERFA
jgi:hypothetical protein